MALMHIGTEGVLTGNVHTFCGKTLRPGDGAPVGAPYCPRCLRKAQAKGLPAFRGRR